MLQGSAPALLLAGLAVTGCGPAAPAITPADIAPTGSVAPFALTDQDGAAFTEADLQGKVWLVDFFFTSCPSFCPLLTGAMSALARDFRGEPDLRLLSITVDPGHDTPEVLRAFAERERLPQDRWLLLTGQREDIAALCERSFRLALGQTGGADGDILHSSRIILVDRLGRLRGPFDALDPAAQTKLRAAVRAVLAEDAAK